MYQLPYRFIILLIYALCLLLDSRENTKVKSKIGSIEILHAIFLVDCLFKLRVTVVNQRSYRKYRLIISTLNKILIFVRLSLQCITFIVPRAPE